MGYLDNFVSSTLGDKKSTSKTPAKQTSNSKSYLNDFVNSIVPDNNSKQPTPEPVVKAPEPKLNLDALNLIPTKTPVVAPSTSSPAKQIAFQFPVGAGMNKEAKAIIPSVLADTTLKTGGKIVRPTDITKSGTYIEKPSARDMAMQNLDIQTAKTAEEQQMLVEKKSGYQARKKITDIINETPIMPWAANPAYSPSDDEDLQRLKSEVDQSFVGQYTRLEKNAKGEFISGITGGIIKPET